MNTYFENFDKEMKAMWNNKTINDRIYYIFHHNDLDGYASACLLISKLREYGVEENNFYITSMNYNKNWENEMSIINNNDQIFILDYSVSNKVNQKALEELYKRNKNIVWIDHHASSKELIDNSIMFKQIAENGYVVTDNSYSATALTYFWIRDEEVDMYYCSLMWVRYVDDHDCWKGQYDESHAFNAGCHFIGFHNCFTKLCYSDSLSIEEFEYSFLYYDDICIDTGYIIKVGEILLTKEEKENSTFITYKSFISTIEIPGENPIKVLCANKAGNSSLFGKYINEFDAVISFIYDGTYWTYNMFSSEKGADCSKYAKYFGKKYGITGGGHMHAAGWSATEMHLKSIGKPILD